MKIEGMSELLESLKEEVSGWELDPPPSNPEAIQYGLYLTAMDILLAETRGNGGYESYITLPDRVKLPRDEYDVFRKQLDPYVGWLMGLWLKRDPGIDADALFMDINATVDPDLRHFLTELKKF